LKHVASAGGVVFLGKKVLLLRKINGDWVIPKGKIEKGETPDLTAIREVMEETGIRAEISDFLGETTYQFKNSWSNHEMIEKNVFWYVMTARSTKLRPLKEEGFVDAQFVDYFKINDYLRYEDERSIVHKGYVMLQEA
jgi:8-oxo-dGTP pyrophosphatase MutT (NUDIX family)